MHHAVIKEKNKNKNKNKNKKNKNGVVGNFGAVAPACWSAELSVANHHAPRTHPHYDNPYFCEMNKVVGNLFDFTKCHRLS